MFDETVAVLGAVGALATAIAVFVAVWQLRTAKQHARSAFEDDLSREYRTIVGDLPAKAFYADSGAFTFDDEAWRAFYRYLDLSNEQLFLARLGRVSAATAEQWKDGIHGNLERLPTFRAAWDIVAGRVPNDFFEDLKTLVPPRDAPGAADVDGPEQAPLGA
ncbi:MAG: hypothetical protein WKF65_08635 [Gaiellaceae bacterium]